MRSYSGRVGFALLVALVAALSSRAKAGPVYFVVSEVPGQVVHGDSYVLPLSDEAEISHARDLIARGPEAAGGSIAVAKIAAGADGINRNVTAPSEPLWGWHVTGFEGFADITAEVLDGWPTFVEQDISGWIANTNGTIGFWTYTVTTELPGPPPVLIPLPAPWLGAMAMMLLAAGTAWRISRGRMIPPLRACPNFPLPVSLV